MTRRYLGMEYDWVAADALGRVALFSTAGFGPLPEWAFDQYQAINHLLCLPIIAVRVDEGPVVDEAWLAAFSSGLLALADDHYYVRTTTPSSFANVRDMSVELRTLFASARLDAPANWEEMSIVNSVHLGLGPFHGYR